MPLGLEQLTFRAAKTELESATPGLQVQLAALLGLAALLSPVHQKLQAGRQ